MAAEDVTPYRNSTLYNHLNRCGVDADDVTKTLNVQQQCVSELPLKLSPVQKIKNAWRWLWFSISPFSVFDIVPRGVSTNELALHYLYKLQQTLRSSPCVQPEDVDFLDAYMGPLGLASFKDMGIMNVKTQLWITILLSILAYKCFIAFMSKNYSIYMAMSSWQLISVQPECATYYILLCYNPVTMTTLGCLILLTVRISLQYTHTREFREVVEKFECFLERMTEFQKVLGKAMTLIQAHEAISLGYTVANKGTPVERIESSKLSSTQRQCPELRQEVFLISRATMLPFKQATQQLLKTAVSKQLGNRTNFLANIPLEQYGPCVTLGHHKDTLNELHRTTDGFSLASLKAMCQLCQLQLTEFVKVVILSSLREPNKNNGAVATLRKISKSITEPLRILKQKVHELNNRYIVDKASILSDKDPSVISPPKHRSDMYNFYNTVHSLNLHLRHAAKKVQELSDELEGCVDGENSAVSDNQNWASKLDQICCFLASCQNCYNECCKHVRRPPSNTIGMGELQSARTPTVTIQETPVGASLPVEHRVCDRYSKHTRTRTTYTNSEVPDVPPADMNEVNHPQYEVYEAYVDKESEPPDPYTSGDPYTYGDFDDLYRTENRRVKRNTNNVLHELRQVLSVIKDDRASVEQSILAKKYGDRGPTGHHGRKNCIYSNRNMNKDIETETVSQNRDVSTNSDNSDQDCTEKKKNQKDILKYKEQHTTEVMADVVNESDIESKSQEVTLSEEHTDKYDISNFDESMDSITSYKSKLNQDSKSYNISIAQQIDSEHTADTESNIVESIALPPESSSHSTSKNQSVISRKSSTGVKRKELSDVSIPPVCVKDKHLHVSEDETRSSLLTDYLHNSGKEIKNTHVRPDSKSKSVESNVRAKNFKNILKTQLHNAQSNDVISRKSLGKGDPKKTSSVNVDAIETKLPMETSIVLSPKPQKCTETGRYVTISQAVVDHFSTNETSRHAIQYEAYSSAELKTFRESTSSTFNRDQEFSKSNRAHDPVTIPRFSTRTIKIPKNNAKSVFSNDLVEYESSVSHDYTASGIAIPSTSENVTRISQDRVNTLKDDNRDIRRALNTPHQTQHKRCSRSRQTTTHAQSYAPYVVPFVENTNQSCAGFSGDTTSSSQKSYFGALASQAASLSSLYREHGSSETLGDLDSDEDMAASAFQSCLSVPDYGINKST